MKRFKTIRRFTYVPPGDWEIARDISRVGYREHVESCAHCTRGENKAPRQRCLIGQYLWDKIQDYLSEEYYIRRQKDAAKDLTF